MTEYETEFEEQKVDLEQRLQDSDSKLVKLEAKLEKLEGERKDLKKENSTNENQLEKLQKELQKTIEKGLTNSKRVVSLEIENEELQNESRHLGYIINDLELKFDTQLEEIELLQNELEEQKLHSEEQIERQKQQLMELSGDLQVKERELKILKFKTLFESPAKEPNPKQALGGSFQAQSARAAFLGRSVTKTSDDFKRMPLLDVLPGQQTRNERLNGGERTLNHHKRDKSRLSQGVLYVDVDAEGHRDDLLTNRPRKQVTGMASESDEGKLQLLGRSTPAANAIVITDVESKRTPSSTFERASEDKGNDLSNSKSDEATAHVDQQVELEASAINKESSELVFHPKPQNEA